MNEILNNSDDTQSLHYHSSKPLITVVLYSAPSR